MVLSAIWLTELLHMDQVRHASTQVFVPFCEELIGKCDMAQFGALVPFQLDYACLRSKVRQPVMARSVTPARRERDVALAAD